MTQNTLSGGVKFRRKKLPGHRYENLEIKDGKVVAAKVHNEDTNTVRKGRRIAIKV